MNNGSKLFCSKYGLPLAMLVIGFVACFPVAAAEAWRSTITDAAAMSSTISFSANIRFGDRYSLGVQTKSTEPLIYQFQVKNRKGGNYHYLFEDGKLYCSSTSFDKTKRIAMDEIPESLEDAKLKSLCLSFPQKISALLNEISNVDYSDLGEVYFHDIRCHGYQIEFYDTPENLKKIHEVLWQGIISLAEPTKMKPEEPYYLIPIKYDLFIGKKDGFLYGWRTYLHGGRMVETAFDNVVLNPNFPPGTFTLPGDCEIETIDNKAELEIFFKTQRTSLSKRITTKTLRFFTSNGVYVVLGLSLLLISTAVMIRKVRNARR